MESPTLHECQQLANKEKSLYYAWRGMQVRVRQGNAHPDAQDAAYTDWNTACLAADEAWRALAKNQISERKLGPA